MTNAIKLEKDRMAGPYVNEAGRQPLDSVSQATETALRRAASERDAFEQEVFETDRFAARVSHERQNLLWRNEALEAKLAAATVALNQHIGRNEALEAQLAAVTEALDQQKRAIAAMYASTSWKFARPVRALKKLFNLIRTQ